MSNVTDCSKIPIINTTMWIVSISQNEQNLLYGRLTRCNEYQVSAINYSHDWCWLLQNVMKQTGKKKKPWNWCSYTYVNTSFATVLSLIVLWSSLLLVFGRTAFCKEWLIQIFWAPLFWSLRSENPISERSGEPLTSKIFPHHRWWKWTMWLQWHQTKSSHATYRLD